MEKANMMQIAEKCGVSLKTVSRVINHPEQVSPKTLKLVRDYMDQCGFQINLLAKGLKQNRTNIIIIFLDKNNGEYMNSWRSNMLKHLFRYANGIGLKVIVSPSDSQGYKGDETDGFYLLSSGIADGAILFEYVENDQRLGYLERTNTPYVLLGQPKDKTIPAVSLDNYNLGYMGGNYLKEKEYKNICYFANEKGYYSTELRVKGFLDAVPKGTVIYGVNTPQIACERAKELFKTGGTDCIFVNGDCFLGVYRAAAECHKRIPQDAAVFATNSLPINDQIYPSLSSLKQDFDNLAEQCISLLQELLCSSQDGSAWDRKQIFLPSFVVERESTKTDSGQYK